jgi:hypothetical protein
MTNPTTPTLFILKNHSNHQQFLSDQLEEKAPWAPAKKHHNHPDIAWFNQDKEGLKIKTVRNLKTELNYPPYQAEQRFFLLCHLDGASVPAQNALLKILEEPPTYAQIWLTAENTANLLPTILSRVSVVNVLAQSDDKHLDQATAASPAQTIYQQLQTDSLSEIIDIAAKYKDRDPAQDLLIQLIKTIHAAPDYPSPTRTHHLKTIQTAQQHLSQNLNVRLTLEHCFFSINKSS